MNNQFIYLKSPRIWVPVLVKSTSTGTTSNSANLQYHDFEIGTSKEQCKRQTKHTLILDNTHEIIHIYQSEKGFIYGSLLTVVTLDVTDEKSVKYAVQSVRESVNHLNVVLNNAGILVEAWKSIEELDLKECMRCIDVITLGPIRVIKHTLIEEGEKAAIINISSDAGSLTNAKAVIIHMEYRKRL